MDKKEETPKITGIVKALGEFQNLCPAIKKEKTAGSGKFTYKYGSLPHIIETIRPHMKKAGLAFTQPIEMLHNGGEAIRTILYDTKTGEKIESQMLLPEIKFQGMNELQSKGSAITYLRRYGLMSILGLVTEEDDNDAAGKTETKAKPAAKKNPETVTVLGANISKATPAPAKKAWLNPEVDGKPNPNWNKALKYLADGGTIADIKAKYQIGKNNEERLLNEAITFDDLPFDRIATEEAEIKSTEGGGVKPGESNVLFDDQGEK